MGLTRHIWKVPYRDVVDMARQAVKSEADALFISCTNLPTYDVIPTWRRNCGYRSYRPTRSRCGQRRADWVRVRWAPIGAAG